MSCSDGSTMLDAGATCKVSCMEGYTQEGGTISCPADADPGQAPENDTTCTLNKCTPYDYETGVIDHHSHNSCDDDTTMLDAGESCVVKCDEGYSQVGGTVTCPSDADPDQEPSEDITCTRNKCSGFDYVDGMHKDAPTNSCSDGVPLEAGESCHIHCGVGYTQSGGFVSCLLTQIQAMNQKLT
eukprot:UN25447